MPTDDREQQFERALARRLRDASPDSQCPDAEALAAYHERTLPFDQMALWKEHIAGCARCQETLALVERSEDVQTELVHAEEWQNEGVLGGKFEALASAAPRAAAPRTASSEIRRTAAPAVEPGTLPEVRRRPPWPWIIPLGTLAACVIVWIGVREIRTQRHNQVLSAQSARREENLPPLSLPAVVPSTQPQGQLKKEPTPAPTPDISVRERKEAVPAAPKAATGAGQGAVAVDGAISSSADTTRLSTPKKQAATSGRAGFALRNPTPSDATASTTSEQVQVTAASPPPQPAATESPTAPAAAQKESTQPPPSTEAVTVHPEALDAGANAASSELAMRASKGLNPLAAMAAADHRYIVAPGDKSAWRVGEAGKIERSTDQGKTWKTQRSGVTVDLTAGSATSDKICWVVGKGGTILLSTDAGKHWKEILSPIDGDLGGIRATDALHASVWDVANRTSYQTSDAGETWSRIANE
jgi:Photosynthesis system II assembly factor YCF48